MPDNNRYNLRGVSAQKEDVHKAIAKLDKGLFPNAFCKIYPDYWGNDEAYCNLMHADGAGTKSILAYLYWKETGDLSVWKGIAIDSIVMNIDDLLCVGATGPFTYSSTIGRNKHLIPGEVISELINGSQSYFDRLKEYGIEVHLMGGETADVGDVVRTAIVDGTMSCRMRRDKLVTTEKMQAGDVVVSLAIILYKIILRVIFGMVIVPENRIGLVTKKFVLIGANRGLPDGRIIATKGEAGFQAQTLPPGLYWFMWPW